MRKVDCKFVEREMSSLGLEAVLGVPVLSMRIMDLIGFLEIRPENLSPSWVITKPNLMR